jgi:formate/nitrite transporter FocA (FNT family)
MAVAPTPSDIFQRAAREGQRRLDQSALELTATGFVAGFTIVFGIVALGIAHAAFVPMSPDLARVAGALAFGLGLALLIVQRAELFSENFFDPMAAAFEHRASHRIRGIARLWTLTLAFNLLGGALLAALVTVEGVLPPAAAEAIASTAHGIASRTVLVGFVSAVIGGVLVASLSYALHGAGSVASRLLVAYAVGALLAAGPFDHVVVTVLHLFAGLRTGADIEAGRLVELGAIVILGNLVGGVGLVTLSHVAQARGSGDDR